jgi:RNA polymerase sigma factor (sigma-70 family)
MTSSAMFTRLRPAVLAIAAEWRVPGLDPDDVRQEALLALWVATSKHDPARGPWPPFARLVVKRRLRDLLQAATRQKRTAALEHDVDVAAPEPTGASEQLALVIDALPRLTDRERSALANSLNGGKQSKSQENALGAARRKLRAA